MFENIEISNKLPKGLEVKIEKITNSWLSHYKIAEFSVYKNWVKALSWIQMFIKVVKISPENGEIEKIQVPQSSLGEYFDEKIKMKNKSS